MLNKWAKTSETGNNTRLNKQNKTKKQKQKTKTVKIENWNTQDQVYSVTGNYHI